MENFLFEDVEGFVDKFLEEWDKFEDDDDDFYTISVVSHYNIMKDIINYLVQNTGFILCNLELEEPTYRDYDDEYILTVDSDGEIWCQKAKVDGRYIHVEDNLTFVHSDVNSKFVLTNKNENMVEFGFGSEEETVCTSDCDCMACEDCPHKPEMDVTVGDNGYEIKIKCNLDAEDALKVIENIEARMERVNDIFREMNEWRKLLRF